MQAAWQCACVLRLPTSDVVNLGPLAVIEALLLGNGEDEVISQTLALVPSNCLWNCTTSIILRHIVGLSADFLRNACT